MLFKCTLSVALLVYLITAHTFMCRFAILEMQQVTVSVMCCSIMHMTNEAAKYYFYKFECDSFSYDPPCAYMFSRIKLISQVVMLLQGLLQCYLWFWCADGLQCLAHTLELTPQEQTIPM